MASPLLCSLLTFLPFLISNKLAIATALLPPPQPPIAKHGCKFRCGNVNIPYPFGIGANHCYLDEWFKIDCKRTENSTSVKAFLSKINMEVLNIYYQQNHTTIRVNSPIISSNCSDRKTGKPVYLTGSPFTFSNTENSFIVLGCSNRILLTSDSSIHNKNTQNPPCQNMIPLRLQEFNVSFPEEEEGGGGRCKLAFIVENEWLFDKVDHEEPNVKIRDRDYVPVIFDWSISHSKLALFKMDANTPSTRIITYDDEKEKGNASWYHLVCNHGYNGNPYLPGGCKDIDECKDPKTHWCNGIRKCVNKPGSFECVPDPLWIIIFVVAGVFGMLGLLFGTWWLYKLVKKRRQFELKKKFFKRNGGLLLQQQFNSRHGSIQKTKMFSSKELEKATDRFNENRILGQGGQGTVYKGMLADGRIVAVKKSKLVDEEKLQEFVNEVVILSQINHRNVVQLLGCCLETDVPILVCEFTPNGSLFQYLHDQNEEVQLSWEMRLRIAGEAAGAIAYLHSAASIPIYHRDIKSTNILLDEKFRAKISDFGTSRSIAIDQTHLTTNVQGTFGYLDPEYYQSSQFTEKSDVYSFGVVLVELLSGQKPIICERSNECKSLATNFILLMEENRLFDIIDARIVNNSREKDIVAVANLARRCLDLSARKRPTMKEVAIELERIRSSSQSSKLIEQDSQTNSKPSVHSVSVASLDSDKIVSLDIEQLISYQTW